MVIRIGTCSWTDHHPFYPLALEKRERRGEQLGYYAQFFSVVEIDSTYYHLQPVRNFRRWASASPDDFVFNVKAYGELTWHHRSSDRQQMLPRAETHAQFRESLQPLREANKLGAVMFQFAPWFVWGETQRAYLMRLREFYPQDRITIEFRHRSWYSPDVWVEVQELLRELEYSYVIVDEPQIGEACAPPFISVTAEDLAVFRFHGRNRATWYLKGKASPGDRFNYLYSPEELREWITPIDQVAHDVREVHALFNNNHANYAVVNAFNLAHLLKLPVPDPPPGVAEVIGYQGGGARPSTWANSPLID
ncbi:MAG: DUF72 domain-containing protein [Chloroflexi bacterium]|nr:DUF72 domain-containing protein [Chloroflexota bacterium]